MKLSLSVISFGGALAEGGDADQGQVQPPGVIAVGHA